MTYIYTEPTASTAITTALGQQNNSVNALLKTFYGTSFPTSSNLLIGGNNVATPNGMLYRNETTGVLYIMDATAKKNSGSSIPGNWTRNGLGIRVFDTETARDAVLSTFEMGELVLTLDTQKLTFANVVTEGGTATFINVGGDSSYQVSGSDVTIVSDSLTVSDLYTNDIYVDSTIYHNNSASYLGFNISNDFIVSTNSVTRFSINGVSGITTFYNNLYIPEYIYHEGDSDTYLRFQNNNIQLFSGGNKGVEVTSNGYVGIGAPPGHRLDVQQTGTTVLRVKALSSGAGNDDDAIIVLDSAELGEAHLSFRESSVAKARVEWVGGKNQLNIMTEAGTNAPIDFQPNTVLTMRITEGLVGITGNLTASGDVTAYSDIRLKSDIDTITNALDKVSSLRGVYFTKDNNRSIGVIAQEVLSVVPELVRSDGDYLSVAYGNALGLLIEAIKELKNRIEYLK